MGCGDFFLRRLTRWHILLIGFFLKYISQKAASEASWAGCTIKLGGIKRKSKRNQTVRIVCLYQEEFGFCTWLGSPLLWNMSCPGTLELVLMGTNSQGTAEGGALPKLPGEDCRHQGREHQGCFQQGKCSVQ